MFFRHLAVVLSVVLSVVLIAVLTVVLTAVLTAVLAAVLAAVEGAVEGANIAIGAKHTLALDIQSEANIARRPKPFGRIHGKLATPAAIVSHQNSQIRAI